jgi:hypothetical protein
VDPYAPPAAPPAPPAAVSVRTLGTTALVLGILELCYCGFRLVSQALNATILAAEKSMFRTTPHGPPMGALMDEAQVYAHRIAPWEMLRTVPFAVATGVLVWIAVRLRRGDEGALEAARRWIYWALGAVVFSLLVQLVFTLPATMEYQRHVVAAMPVLPGHGGAPPVDTRELMGSMTLVSTILGVVFGTAFLSAWPIVFHVWSGRLLRRLQAVAAG